MTEFLSAAGQGTLNLSGLVIAVASFLAIGLFHPLVIKGEYHFGVRIWPAFALVGIICLIVGCWIEDIVLSAILAIVGVCSLWSIGELFKQRERVAKGWFPQNPKRGKTAALQR